MALRHAVLAALLDEELSGYQVTKAFAAGVANFWHALPQQVYAELARLEKEGLVAGREVVQVARPNKRLFRVTGEGLAELESFASAAAKPSFLREDLLVQVQAADHLDTDVLIDRLTERYAFAEAKAALFEEQLRAMRGERGEAEFLLHGARVGPYLTCRRGRDFERANRDWCRDAVEVLRARREARADS
ncbi:MULTISPECIES: PadR family transcriptional regulator [Streptomyces]|uniref:PadR-like family transcriptional regulator n=1 Tax=Streptomyces griseus subsp. griseus (strain JCM 4626 / CBS 651.72 / NBRC 13350 / KCC S-0626 / ISP 5235) TaxID=455632 RepID=B1VLR9_STRGG|nr:PadR family transcriptional regulator [Streptomyces griseus]MYR14164.1 PadR family transcriptional regulator [Streptomyces sp. SID724]MBW3709217.1 PadR family transcriptional regulator [Streptomyces griseus]NEB54445.1 PadR family transcriptional regulator [Streptomyces griseus]SEE33886.1 DNA-binding transcriptional regulator, PadR family [Streptomyces griseus]SQA25099.1 PadR-like family transcriptional regulator [Streptomyces griseus]